ncbi:hypothetical protein ID866_4215 [Astraeus odoratus]|nr:hypothetical protein ID866_4215 [Astraeus odoratus]
MLVRSAFRTGLRCAWHSQARNAFLQGIGGRSALHQNSGLTLNNQRLTLEGSRSLAALRSTLHVPPGAPDTEEAGAAKPQIRIFILGARAESSLPPHVWEQLCMLFPSCHFHLFFIGPQVSLPKHADQSPVQGTSSSSSSMETQEPEKAYQESTAVYVPNVYEPPTPKPIMRLKRTRSSVQLYGVPSYTVPYSPQLTITGIQANYSEVHPRFQETFDPYTDVFFLFSPGFGFPSMSSVSELDGKPLLQIASPTEWGPVVPALLATRCAVFVTGFSPADVERDIRSLDKAPDVAGEFEWVITPGENAFGSEKWEVADFDPRVMVKTNWDVDALSAARMLAELFTQDDVMHRIIPVSGIAELENMKDELATYTELHTLILINMGAILDLPSPVWFGEFSTRLTIHVIDSTRPQNLGSLFGGGDMDGRIVIWDDGEADNMGEERKAWEALEYEPEPDSDEDSAFSSEDEASSQDGEETEDFPSDRPCKRKLSNDGQRSAGKRRKVAERAYYQSVIDKHYTSGSWYGQSASATIYILATILERVDRDLLWLAILGLTYQYTTARISRDTYDKFHSIYHDEVTRLNPLPADVTSNPDAITALNPDDLSLRATEELRFTLFRHWTLYDAMFHSSYVAGKLGIWKERGRKRLTGLLAKMGFSIPQTQQPYTHMDLDLKHQLRSKLDAIAPEYGLVELTYPSFVRCFGYRAPPLSAADAIEAIGALLDVAGGVQMEVEVEGARNGGEWFGGGRLWEGGKQDADESKTKQGVDVKVHGSRDGNVVEERTEVPWWVKNFWAAYDALTEYVPIHLYLQEMMTTRRSVVPLRDALTLSMSLHRAIIRQGTSIIDKQDIRTLRSHRVVVLSQGPDLPLFAHPGILSRLALWLIDALRDKLPGTKLARGKKSLPFVLACLNEKTATYIVVGVMGALEFGDVRKNEFGLAFINAKDRCNARSSHTSFNTSVLEIDHEDLKIFLEALCEVGEGY